jgi:N,N-dimethylformamidase
VLTGDAFELNVHAPAQRFDLAVIRYGKTERIMLEVHDLPGEAQTRPRAAYHLGAGWPVAWRCVVDRMWKPGLYGLRLSDPAGGAITVPLVVRAAAPRARLLVLASTNTWAAHNEWGGASTYHWLKEDALGRDRARGVSRFRPNPAADPDRGDGHLARGLVELVRWLDRSGYAHDLAIDEDAHSDPTLFERYRCLMTDPHAEYWTADMRSALERFLARGGALAYLSGDGLQWKTHAAGDGIEVVKPWGVFADGDMGGLWADLDAPASKLTGVAYTPVGANTYAPFCVLSPDHWIFAGTGVAAGTTFGERGTFGGASGHTRPIR